MPSEKLETGLEILVWSLLGSLLLAGSVRIQSGLEQVARACQADAIALSLICDLRNAYEKGVSLRFALPNQLAGHGYTIQIEGSSLIVEAGERYVYQLQISLAAGKVELLSGRTYLIATKGGSVVVSAV